jgi:hypothetical protein
MAVGFARAQRLAIRVLDCRIGVTVANDMGRLFAACSELLEH